MIKLLSLAKMFRAEMVFRKNEDTESNIFKLKYSVVLDNPGYSLDNYCKNSCFAELPIVVRIHESRDS